MTMDVKGGKDQRPRKYKVTLEACLNNVDSVIKLPLPDIDIPNIDAATLPLNYEANTSTEFVDRNAFVTGVSKFIEEANQQSKLAEVLEEGNTYAATLYTWRSCSLAIPSIISHDQPNRKEIYQRTVDVLEPEIAKLREFLVFQKGAVETFCQDVKRVLKDQHEFLSEAYLLSLGKVINIFATLDGLKNSKAGIKNDYASYKRAGEILKIFSQTQAIENAQELSMFLGTRNFILTHLKSRLQSIAGFEDLLSDIITVCLQNFEQEKFLLPSEKYAMVKVIGFCLYLIDSEKVNINKLDSRKKISLRKIDKIFKQVEVVPLYGDMMVSPFSYIKETPNFDENCWSHCLSDTPSQQSNILRDMTQLREQYIFLVCDLTLQGGCRQLMENIAVKPQSKPKMMNEGSARELRQTRKDRDVQWKHEITFRTLRKLSKWTSTLTELFSWKLIHPADPKDCPSPDVEEYERATRYNYSSEEKLAIVEMIAMIKSVEKIILQMEADLSEAISRHIYTEFQNFVQVHLREPLRKAVKHKKEITKNLLLGIMESCMDCEDPKDFTKDPIMKGKKDSDTKTVIQTARKQSHPSSTQLYLLRAMLECLIDKGTGKKSLRKDLETSHIQSIEKFLKDSYFWPHLLNLNSSLQACCDLSQFWYREFYLEMTSTMQRKIQFPIEMSMPWILTDHLLESENRSMIEHLLCPLDLYNDSAQCALFVFKKQFLYNEIEAEVNLCFDQLIYKLSEQVFEYYKHMAGSMVLDKKFKAECKKQRLTIKYPAITRYDSILKQRNFQLLGRSIDLQKLITQRITTSLLKALDVAISRFEAGDITDIVELEGLMECNCLAYKLLKKHLPLPDFSTLFRESNHSVTSPYGRITLTLFYKLNSDFMPQFCYNGTTNRFVRTIYPFVDRLEKEKPPTAHHYYIWGSKVLHTCYSAIYSQYNNFVGLPHFQAICSLMDYLDFAVILRELLSVIQRILTDAILPYVKTLRQVMPKRCIMPRYEYGSPGILEYYQAQLHDIIGYADLQPKLFQTLRELGNAMLFCHLLEHYLSQKEVVELTHSAIFQNIIPKPFVAKKANQTREEMEAEFQKRMKALELKYRRQDIVTEITQYGSEVQAKRAKQAAVLAREKLCCGLSIFDTVLKKIRGFLNKSDWQGNMPARGLLDVTENAEFHRLWSAMQFVFCIPARSNAYTVEELFGEGLNWAACVLITLLGQQRRFEAMDFSYHLLKVHDVDQKNSDTKGVNVKKMVDRVRKFQILNNQIFAIVNKFMGRFSLNAGPDIGVDVHNMQPPVYEADRSDSVFFENTDDSVV